MNLEQFLARLKTASAALTAKQLVVLGVAFLAVVGLTIGSGYWLNTPTYGVLFADMDAESASGIVAKLKAEKVQYSLDDGGRTIRVPAARVDELRLQFASDGLPGSGRVGFELFDRTAFGVTDFLEHVNYRRALEGELARTISTISEVASARVHIAMPQPSLFATREQTAKASVVVKLRNNRPLLPSTVAAVTGLVSASVEGLRPESVVIIDNYGRPLSKPADDAEEAATVPLERQQGIERDLSTRVVALLEPIVGVGRVRVNVSAKLRTDAQDEVEERWDPTPVVRSHQSVIQGGSATKAMAGAPGGLPLVAGAIAQGVAGTRANLPPDPQDGSGSAAKGAAAPGPALASTSVPPDSRVAETTNYEVSKVTRHSTTSRGSLARLSVAVVLDDEHVTGEGGKPSSKPRAAADIQKIHGLVAAAVGFDADRGDQLTVENIPFEETPAETEPPAKPWERYKPLALDAGRIVGIVILGLVALLGVIRPLVRTSFGAVPAAVNGALPAPRTVQDLEAEMDAQLEGAAGARRMPVLTRRVAALTQREPENAARLLRTWLTEPER